MAPVPSATDPGELERSLAHLRQIVDAAPVMLYQWVLSATGEAGFTFVSEGSRAIYGLTPEQLLADMRYSLQVVHPDDMASFRRAVAESAEHLTSFSWQGRIVLPGATGSRTRWLRAQSTPTRLPDGSTRWEGVMVDITEQCDVARWMLDAHAALAGARDLDAIVDAVVAVLSRFAPLSIDFSRVHAAEDGRADEIEIIHVWQDGRAVADHPMLGRRFAIGGSPFGDAIVRDPLRALYVPDIERDPAAAAQVKDLPRDVRSVAVLPLYSERHGTWEGVIVVQWSRRHEPDEAERLLHALLIHATAAALAGERARARNEALLRRLEEALRESRQQQRMLSVLFDNLPVGLAVLRGDTGEHLLVNPVGRDAMGHDPGDAAAATGLHVFRPGDDEPLPADEQPPRVALRTGETQRLELEFRRPDGARRPFDVIATPLRQTDDPEPRVVLIFNDLTPVRTAERERLLVQEELLRVQAVALAERSTPLIPVRDDVLVMPLIGTIDADRGRQILDVLLQLGGRTRVRTAILDLTGVATLDTAAASAVLAAAGALRLRGVQPVLTGIRPAAAAALAELGVDFAGIDVSGSVQDAIDRVLRGR